MKRIISLVLVFVMALSLVACGGNETAQPTETKAKTNVADPLTWAQIDAIPVADDSMTEEQLRQICMDYMRLMLTFAWTPSIDHIYNNGSANKQLLAGMVYGGLPYTPACNGNLYTVMEFYDSDNGMLDLSGVNDTMKAISNQCSSSTFWSWSRVCNTMVYDGGTSGALVKNGYLRVGPYTYDDNLGDFNSANSTNNICMVNGPEVMFESYAAAEPADGLIQNSGKGHFRMVASTPNVVRNPDGTIDGFKSTLTFLDQVRNWTPGTQSNGTPYEIEGGVDVKVTFFDLFNTGYIPVTFAELNKENPVEKSEASVDVSGDSVTIAQLAAGKATSNYPISNIIITVKDNSGKQVYRKGGVAHLTGIQCTAPMSVAVESDGLKAYADGKHTVEISLRIGTGELINVYTGTLAG